MKRILFLITVMILMASCRSTKLPVYEPSEQSHDTVYVNKLFRDTIYHQDSVFMVMELRNDTVYKERVQYKYIYKEHIRIDTTYISKCDTITRRVITNELTAWQKKELEFGKFAIVILLAIIVGLVAKIINKFRKS